MGKTVQKATDHCLKIGKFLSGLRPLTTSIASPKSKKAPHCLYNPRPSGSLYGSPHYTKKSGVHAELTMTLLFANLSQRIISYGFIIMFAQTLAPSRVVDVSPKAIISLIYCKIPEKYNNFVCLHVLQWKLASIANALVKR